MRTIFVFCFLAAGVMSAQDLSRWNANVGAGPSFGMGDVSDRVNTGFNFTAGGGFNFSRQFGIEADYLFNDFGLSDKALNAANAPGGYAHVWGFSANPVFRIAPEGKKLGAYFLGGYGVFTRTVNLTRPGAVPAVICDPWTFFCYSGAVYADVIYRSNSTTKGGWDVGGGVTYRLGEGRTNFFAEVRYYDVLTTNVRSTFLPITFGLRW
jgi:opacity protein-like surface antigen